MNSVKLKGEGWRTPKVFDMHRIQLRDWLTTLPADQLHHQPAAAAPPQER